MVNGQPGPLGPAALGQRPPGERLRLRVHRGGRRPCRPRPTTAATTASGAWTRTFSRPWLIFWNGRIITSAWLARARPLRHPQCQRGAFSFLAQREKEREAGRREAVGGGWLDFGDAVSGAERGKAEEAELLAGGGCCSWSWPRGWQAVVGFSACPHAKLGKRQRSRHAAPAFFYRARPPNIRAARLDSTHSTDCEIFRCSCDNVMNRALQGGVALLSSCLWIGG